MVIQSDTPQSFPARGSVYTDQSEDLLCVQLVYENACCGMAHIYFSGFQALRMTYSPLTETAQIRNWKHHIHARYVENAWGQRLH